MTSNPSEEHLELVTSRIIDIAQAVCPFVSLDDNSYFDEAGFVKEMSSELHRRLLVYVNHAEGVNPSLEDYPQPRRMARYLLENVEIEVLETPLAPCLLEEFTPDARKAEAGIIAWTRKHSVLAAITVLVVIFLCVLIVFALRGAASEGQAQLTKHEHVGTRHGGRGKGVGWRNGSGSAKI